MPVTVAIALEIDPEPSDGEARASPPTAACLRSKRLAERTCCSNRFARPLRRNVGDEARGALRVDAGCDSGADTPGTCSNFGPASHRLSPDWRGGPPRALGPPARPPVDRAALADRRSLQPPSPRYRLRARGARSGSRRYPGRARPRPFLGTPRLLGPSAPLRTPERPERRAEEAPGKRLPVAGAVAERRVRRRENDGRPADRRPCSVRTMTSRDHARRETSLTPG